jgi:hypothetical protein
MERRFGVGPAGLGGFGRGDPARGAFGRRVGPSLLGQGSCGSFQAARRLGLGPGGGWPGAAVRSHRFGGDGTAVPWWLTTRAPASVRAGSARRLRPVGAEGRPKRSLRRARERGYGTSGNRRRATAAVMRYGC